MKYCLKIYYWALMILFTTYCYPQNPCLGFDSINYGGRWYHTVQIGSQCWLKENLNVGRMIKVDEQQKNNDILEKYCGFGDSNYCKKFGGLYQWDEAMQYSVNRVTVQGICPLGWHIPASNEIDTLIKMVNNNGKVLTALYGGTNSSGFSIIGGTIRFARASFGGNNIFFGYFWSSKDKNIENAIYFCLQRGGDSGDLSVGGIRQIIGDKNDGRPIRCLKD